MKQNKFRHYCLLIIAYLSILPGMSQEKLPHQPSFTIALTSDSAATLTAFLPEQPTGRSLMAIPGGGYKQTSIANACLWAPFFNELGYAFFILKYRMPEGDRTIPIGDAEKALRIIRDSAEQWHIRAGETGIMGSSAGGHLATTIVCHSDSAIRPAFQVLFYPVITFGYGCHKGSRDRFLGKDNTDKTLVQKYSSEQQVAANTPPAIIFTCSDDRAVPTVYNSVAYYSAMTLKGCDATLHVYPKGGHGWKYTSDFGYREQILSELSQWLKQR